MDAFEEIYRRYAVPVWRFLLRLGADEDTADDLTAETFLRALRYIDSYDGSVQMFTWLCTIAKRLYFNYKKKKDNQTQPLLTSETLVSPLPTPQQTAETREAAAELYRTLVLLPSPQKDVIWLHAFANLPLAEIASIFGKSESWARVTYYRAKEKLKEMLNNET